LAGTDIITMNIWALYISILAAWIAWNEVWYRFWKKTWNYFYTREQSFFLKKAHLDYAREFYQRYWWMAVIYARFVPIARTIIPIIAWVVGMENKKFIRYNVIWSFLRVSLFVLWWYFLWTQYREEVELYFHYIIFGILFISTTPVLIWLIKRSFFAHNKKESEEMDIPEWLL
jgi:membrane-associated protein